MKLQSKLQKFGLQNLKLKTSFLEVDWQPNPIDQQAAWELYIELLTRVATQPLAGQEGQENSALSSVYSIFPTTREILKSKGRECSDFSKIAIVVLNQVIRPFTAKWHPLSEKEAFKDRSHCEQFRADLLSLQKHLKNYTALLADIAGVEDLTELENGSL
jgi:hypothetical protein